MCRVCLYPLHEYHPQPKTTTLSSTATTTSSTKRAQKGSLCKSKVFSEMECGCNIPKECSQFSMLLTLWKSMHYRARTTDNNKLNKRKKKIVSNNRISKFRDFLSISLSLIERPFRLNLHQQSEFESRNTWKLFFRRAYSEFDVIYM